MGKKNSSLSTDKSATADASLITTESDLQSGHPDDSSDQEYLFPSHLSDHYLIAFGILFLWPLLIPVSIVFGLLRKFGGLTSLHAIFPSFLLWLPWALIKNAMQNRIPSLMAGIILLMPLLLFAIIGAALPSVSLGPENLVSPNLSHLLGTDGLGRDILMMLIKGSVNTYLIALFATCVSIGLGAWFGIHSIQPKFETPTLGFVQLIESIPTLAWTIMLLTAYSFWQASLNPDMLTYALMERLRPAILGILIGLCFMPNIYRLVRDKVKYFSREEFIDMSRAHGISLRRILWVHILFRNGLSDLMISGGALPGVAILTLLNIDYFFSISSFQVGAARYASWTQMLLTPEAKDALLFFQNLWLVIPPSFLIIMTAIGGYLYGSGLRTIRNLNETTGLLVNPKSNFYKTVSRWQQF
jgi:peptide/nickel transport system permease protein